MKDIWLPSLGLLPAKNDPLVNAVGDTPELKPDVQKAMLALFGNRYPIFTGNGTLATKAMTAALDPNADFWTFVAADITAGGVPGAETPTAYDQVTKRDPSMVVLVSLNDLDATLQGKPVPGVDGSAPIAAVDISMLKTGSQGIRYVIVKNKALATQVASLINATVAVASPITGEAAPGAAPTKKMSTAAWLLTGATVLGAGALIFGGAHRRPRAAAPLL